MVQEPPPDRGGGVQKRVRFWGLGDFPWVPGVVPVLKSGKYRFRNPTLKGGLTFWTNPQIRFRTFRTYRTSISLIRKFITHTGACCCCAVLCEPSGALEGALTTSPPARGCWQTPQLPVTGCL